MSVLEVDNVHKTYAGGSVTALAGVSLHIQAGEFVAVMGASGSGKSTLLHLMAGLTKPDQGRVVIDGTDITGLNDRRLTLFRRRHVGLVFQSFNLIPTLTARENLELPLALDGERNPKRVDELLARLGIAHRADHLPDALSGGEQQRIAIGRALVTDPAVILADEPTGNLDSANSRAVCELLRDLAQHHNKNIVMVTHEPSVAAYTSQVILIRDGTLLDRFKPDPHDGGAGLAGRYHARVSAR
jgi:putative ABC transport system ATP-binding protein